MTKTKAFLQKHRWSLTGALLGALVFLVLYGVRVLDPVCVDWILNNPSPDPSQHYLGWVFYRRSGWHLPYLGANYSAIYPYRTSILYTDSIPLLAGCETLRVFLTCAKEEQTRRLQAREGERYANFAARWVPLEEGYFAQYGIAESADFVVETTK